MGAPGKVSIRGTSLLSAGRSVGIIRATHGRCGMSIPGGGPNRPCIVRLGIHTTGKAGNVCQSTLAWVGEKLWCRIRVCVHFIDVSQTIFLSRYPKDSLFR